MSPRSCSRARYTARLDNGIARLLKSFLALLALPSLPRPLGGSNARLRGSSSRRERPRSTRCALATPAPRHVRGRRYGSYLRSRLAVNAGLSRDPALVGSLPGLDTVRKSRASGAMLACNACWCPLDSGSAYISQCDHVYCACRSRRRSSAKSFKVDCSVRCDIRKLPRSSTPRASVGEELTTIFERFRRKTYSSSAGAATMHCMRDEDGGERYSRLGSTARPIGAPTQTLWLLTERHAHRCRAWDQILG